jgi:LacI family transcriptional regulator
LFTITTGKADTLETKVTIKAIAKAAGVSIGTVDRALNNRPNINEEKKQLVLSVAKSLGYSKNILASSLSKKTKLKVALIYPSNPSFFWGKLDQGFKDAVRELEVYGIQFETYISEEFWTLSEDFILRSLDQIEENGADLVALVALNSEKVKQRLRGMIANNQHVVTITEEFSDLVPLFHVGTDNYQIGRISAELMGKFLKGQGNIFVVIDTYIGKDAINTQRLKGFEQYFKTRFPMIRVVKTLFYDYSNDQEHNVKMLHDILKNSDSSERIDGIYGLDGESLTKIGQVVRDFGMGGNLVLIGHEISDEVAEMLHEGIIDCVISQDAHTQGYESVRHIARFLLSGEMPRHKLINTGSNIIVQENCRETQTHY